MRIACIGGGPAALYFALLMKKARSDVDVTVFERNRADDTFGWGVVFSEETLGNIQAADPISYAAIADRFVTWDDIDTYFRGEKVTSTGHGFCGLARVTMLQILQARCRELGVDLVFEHEVGDLEPLLGHDLVLAADGVNSRVRDHVAEHVRPRIEWGACRFAWLGTTRPLDAFTFVFRENEHGLFVVHAYPFEPGRSTFIVECHETTWRRAGLDRATEDETVRYMAALFEDHLDGHPLLTNRSIWRSFPTVTNERWHHGNVVLVGDAAHTAHFSIGSGTKLAMEDSIALVDALLRHDLRVPAALAAYEEARHVDVLKLQKAARTSQAWFENASRYQGQNPLAFAFNLMTRSQRITYENLAARDPDLVERVTEWFGATHGGPRRADGRAAPPMFAPFEARGVRLENRVVVSPMCQYRAVDGRVGDWHLVHLGSFARGGPGLVFTEMTDVSPEARISLGCAGIWSDEHVAAWRRVVEFVHAESPSKIGLQLGHAGRKGSCRLPWEGGDPLSNGSAWTTLGPSALPYDDDGPAPRPMTRDDMDRTIGLYEAATRRAVAAGFDVIEVHMAHGYLLSSFLSPAANHRTDAYGGTLENRLRFPLEVLAAVRACWPSDRPLFVRISATDWLEDEPGTTPADAVGIARALYANGADVVDVSSGGNSPRSAPRYGRMYQVPFAERIRYEAPGPVMAVGGIQGWDHVNTVLAAERADLCALARPHLVDPHLTLRAAVHYGVDAHPWPRSYLPARPAPRADVPSS